MKEPVRVCEECGGVTSPVREIEVDITGTDFGSRWRILLCDECRHTLEEFLNKITRRQKAFGKGGK